MRMVHHSEHAGPPVLKNRHTRTAANATKAKLFQVTVASTTRALCARGFNPKNPNTNAMIRAAPAIAGVENGGRPIVGH